MPNAPSSARFALAAAALSLACSAGAETFKWNPDAGTWGAWHDPANWSIAGEGDDASPAGAVPGAGDRLFSEQTFRFDLGGRDDAEIGGWSIGSWTQRHMYLRNGTLNVHGPWPVHGGLIDVGAGATLRFVPGAFFMPGASDAAGRRVHVAPGGALDLTDADVNLFNGAFEVEPGGTARLGTRSWKTSFKAKFRFVNKGLMELPHGLGIDEGNLGGAVLALHPGSVTKIAGDVAGTPKGADVDVLVEGGRIEFSGDSAWHVGTGFVQTNATVQIDVAPRTFADLSALEWGPGTTLELTGEGFLALGASRPAKIVAADARRVVSPGSDQYRKLASFADVRKIKFTVEGDSANRTWFLFYPERWTNFVKSVTYTFPQPEAGRADGRWSVSTSLPYFHRRYPADPLRRPFSVEAKVETRDGLVFSTNLVVNFNQNPIGKPAPNEEVMIGMVSYGPGRERYEMITNDLANLYVRWNAHTQLLPEKANSEIMPDWLEQAKKRRIHCMTIYGTTPPDMRERIKQTWGDLYLGNNVGERTGFLYGSPPEMKGPTDLDLDEAREWFVCKFLHGMQRGMVRGAPGENPFFFSTSGAAAAGYEMQGGVDYVCNELYAVGCLDLTYAQSEARGAARRWGPEWWCGWLAHEWQTFGTPYDDPAKSASLEAGMKSLWVMGTSLMCLESGSSGTQAHPHTWGVPEDRRKTGYSYDEQPPTMYRDTVRRVHLWQKEHPRAAGTPDTSIALALGCNDGYIGSTAYTASRPFAQHANFAAHAEDTCDIWKPGEKINIWGASHPENTWYHTRRGVFRSPGTSNVCGTPFGQVDVVLLDDEIRLADIARYKFIVFGGWNTMKPPAAAVLRRWMEAGGTLLCAAPQLTTRVDRDFLGYAVSDLLSPLPWLRFTGFSEADEFFRNGPAEVEGLTRFGRPAANGQPAVSGKWSKTKVRLVDFETAPGRPAGETVVSAGEKPLVVRFPVGKGWFYLFASRDFPVATGETASLWTDLIYALADSVPQRMTLEPLEDVNDKGRGDGRRFFTFATYRDKAYLLNLDWQNSHRVRVKFAAPGGGVRAEDVQLAPLEIREWPLR